MTFKRMAIKDVILCKPTLHGDERGYFVETFRKDLLEKFLGYDISFCQDNESKSSYGVLRGLHYQLEPYAQTKLVRAIKGEILDIAVDIRQNSPTFGRYVSAQLTEENRKQLLIPKGFAHGFIVLSDEAIFAYKVDNYYSANHDRGIAFNDKELNINWQIPHEDLKLSQKDLNQPSFKNGEYFS